MTLFKNFTLKELSKTFHNTKSAKHKIWEADTNLESDRTICQGPEKILAHYLKLFYKKKASTAQTIFDKSFTKKYNTFILT